jgi:hypothetical protein
MEEKIKPENKVTGFDTKKDWESYTVDPDASKKHFEDEFYSQTKLSRPSQFSESDEPAKPKTYFSESLDAMLERKLKELDSELSEGLNLRDISFKQRDDFFNRLRKRMVGVLGFEGHAKESEVFSDIPVESVDISPLLTRRSQLKSYGETAYQRKGTKKSSLTVFLLVLLGATLAGIYSYWGRAQITPLPYTHTVGPVLDGDKIYIADWFRKTLFIHENSKEFRIVAVEPLPNDYTTGLSLVNGQVWSLDGYGRQMLKHSLSADRAVADKISVPGLNPVGLFWDGSSLWSADKESKIIYRYQSHDFGAVKYQYTVPSASIDGFYLKDNRLWIVDGKSQEIVVYRLADPLVPLTRFNLGKIVGAASPTGLAITSRQALVLTENPSQLISIPLHRLHGWNQDKN